MTDTDRFDGTRTVTTPYGDRDVEWSEYVDLRRLGLLVEDEKAKPSVPAHTEKTDKGV